MPQRKLLFLTLNTFSSTGGIERVCRIAGKALHEIAQESGYAFDMFSMYDQPSQVLDNYVPEAVFSAFSGRRISFIKQAIHTGKNSDIVILSHVNLLVVGAFIKVLSPRTKVVLIAHGIEVWKPFPSWKRRMLSLVDIILPVSEFTRDRMQALYGLRSEKFLVVNNCLDPFLQPVVNKNQYKRIREKHGLNEQDLVLFTLTRIKSSEQYKGYDKVINALPEVLKKYPNIKYLIAGKYDAAEKRRLDLLVAQLRLQDQVAFAGFVGDEEIADYYQSTDVYIMPSSGEGFGIVFIEALYYGLPVIAGNVDGSVDALDKGKLGLLVNPQNQHEIVSAISSILNNKAEHRPNKNAVWAKFGFPTYKSNLRAVLGL